LCLNNLEFNFLFIFIYHFRISRFSIKNDDRKEDRNLFALILDISLERGNLN